MEKILCTLKTTTTTKNYGYIWAFSKNDIFSEKKQQLCHFFTLKTPQIQMIYNKYPMSCFYEKVIFD